MGLPVSCQPQKDGSVLTVDYMHLNALIKLDDQLLPRVDSILDCLYKGKAFSIFNLNSAFHQIVPDRDTVPLATF